MNEQKKHFTKEIKILKKDKHNFMLDIKSECLKILELEKQDNECFRKH